MTCAFADSLNGWAAGDSGVIIHTSDAGQNWTLQNSGISDPVSSIFFLNERLGWGISNSYSRYGTTILHTTNGGGNWTYSFYPDTLLWLTSIYYLDSLTGYLGGQYGTILKTTNSGSNWNRCAIDTGAYSNRTIYRFIFINPGSGLAAGGVMDAGGVVWKTVDSGLHWVSRYVSPEPIYDMILIDPVRAIGSGGDFDFGAAVIKTMDNGNSWNYRILDIFGIGYSLSARTRNEIWVATGYGSYWGVSRDTGVTYQALPIPDTSGIFAVIFTDSLHGWAFGNNGAIYKYNTEAIGIRPNSTMVPVRYNLYQNYPNPFNPATKIKFDIPSNVRTKMSNVKLAVYDILGKEISVLIDSDLSPGAYEFQFDGTNYASGIYFYRLESGSIILSRRMVILK